MYINAKCHVFFQELKRYCRCCKALPLTNQVYFSCNLVFAPCIGKEFIFGASANI